MVFWRFLCSWQPKERIVNPTKTESTTIPFLNGVANMTTASPNPVLDNIVCSYSLDFVAIGANRQANSATWGSNGLVAYSAGKFVGIYDPLVRKI